MTRVNGNAVFCKDFCCRDYDTNFFTYQRSEVEAYSMTGSKRYAGMSFWNRIFIHG